MSSCPATTQGRRSVLIAAAGAALIVAPALHLRARGQALSRRLTPAQTEGPFYPQALPADSDADLLAAEASAEIFPRGVLDQPAGEPVSPAQARAAAQACL